MSSKQKIILALVLLEVIQLVFFLKMNRTEDFSPEELTTVDTTGCKEPEVFKSVLEPFETNKVYNVLDSMPLALNSGSYAVLNPDVEWGPTWSIEPQACNGTRRIEFACRIHSSQPGSTPFIVSVETDKNDFLFYEYLFVPLVPIKDNEEWFLYKQIIEVPENVRWSEAERVKIYFHNRYKLNYAIDDVSIQFLK